LMFFACIASNGVLSTHRLLDAAKSVLT
jgi:hypothetical protein